MKPDELTTNGETLEKIRPQNKSARPELVEGQEK